jgi:hypothetical protein
MTPRKAIRISTPTVEELQALFDLPSEAPQAQGLQSLNSATRENSLQESETSKPIDPDETAEVLCYNEAVIGLDILFEAAASGSRDALKFLRTCARTVSSFAGVFNR